MENQGEIFILKVKAICAASHLSDLFYFIVVNVTILGSCRSKVNYFTKVLYFCDITFWVFKFYMDLLIILICLCFRCHIQNNCSQHPCQWAFSLSLFSFRTFKVLYSLSSYIHVFNSFWVIFCQRCKFAVYFYFFTCEYLVFSVPLNEETVFFIE